MYIKKEKGGYWNPLVGITKSMIVFYALDLETSNLIENESYLMLICGYSHVFDVTITARMKQLCKTL